jgi:hypothetical protein
MAHIKSGISAFVIPEVLSRRQTTNQDRRGASSGLQPSTPLLYEPRRPAVRALPSLLSNAVDERVRRPPSLQANQEPRD